MAGNEHVWYVGKDSLESIIGRRIAESLTKHKNDYWSPFLSISRHGKSLQHCQGHQIDMSNSSRMLSSIGKRPALCRQTFGITNEASSELKSSWFEFQLEPSDSMHDDTTTCNSSWSLKFSGENEEAKWRVHKSSVKRQARLMKDMMNI